MNDETVNEATRNAVEMLEELIAIPSTSRDEKMAADFLETKLKEQGLAPKRKGNNIWCVSPDFSQNRPTYLLNAHIDTVKPTTGWKRGPFKATIEGDRLYGLGSNDCGGGLVSLLETYKLLTIKGNDEYNLVYLASCEEEVSGKGGIESVINDLPPISVAIVGEPTGMQPAIAERGLMVVDVTAKGQSGHAARNEGVNAIYEALPDILWFKSHQFSKVSPLLGAVKMTVTMINSGTQHNVIPNECRFTVDIRSNEFYSNKDILETIRKNINGEAKERSTRLNSSQISTDNILIKKILKMGKTPYGSPTLSDQALMPWPSFKLGPGESARSHTADEFICISEIRNAIRDYIELLS